MSRLGIRLAFAFVLVVTFAVGAVTWRSIRVIEEAHETSLRAAAAERLEAIRREFETEKARTEKALAPLRQVRELRFRVQPRAAPLVINPETDTDASDTVPALPAPVDPAGLQRFLEEIFPVTGLDMLEAIDRTGFVLSRAHWPESFGDSEKDSWILGAVQTGLARSLLREEPFRDTTRLCYVTFLPLSAEAPESGETEIVGALVGGIRIDSLVARLETLTGCEVEISSMERDAETMAATGRRKERAGLMRRADGGLSFADSLDLFENSGAPRPRIWRLRVLLPADAAMESQMRLAEKNGRDGAFAVAAAAFAGLLFALGPTSRLKRLTAAAERIGRGDLETAVSVTGRDEIGILGETLAATATALRDERARLVRSERMAAWRDAGRKLAHELKNALTPVTLSLQTARRAIEKDSGADSPHRRVALESLTAALEEMDDLRHLVNEFSRFARLPEPRLAPYDPVDALRNAARIYAESDAGAPKVIFEVDAKLPAVEADEELMNRVWTNLIANAAHAAGAAGRVKVRIAAANDRGIEVVIEDSGPGLDPSRLAGAREGGSTKPGGWGVGMVLAERIVIEHGGGIEFGNAEEGGARVRVTIPGNREEEA